ncbi:MAG TPA: type II CAAX endopeptidase family protein [Candidatus Dormibacteraeota bacterium]|nr:type II CAAX endopeptidase family protein [Candidatus Dormibacteraeota bacterium]
MEGLAPAAPPQAADRLRWLDLLPVIAFTLLGIILVFAVLVGLARSNRAVYRANLETISLSATLAIYLAFGAGIAVALRRLRAPLAFLGLRWPTLRDVSLTILLLFPWYLGIILVSAASALIFNGGRVVPSNSRLIFVQRPGGVGLLLLALLVTAVAAPICEEVFFRGMLFRLLRTRVPLWAAVLLSAMAFGLAHASPAVSAALLPTFMYMGIVLAVIYVRTGWLTNNILLHAASNAIATVAVYYQAIR